MPIPPETTAPETEEMHRAMGYNYNGKLKSAEILLKEDGTTEMIRRAETPEDYFATIKGFNF